MLTRRDWLLWSAASMVPVCSRCGAAADTPADWTRVFPEGKKSTDPRLGAPVTLNGYFPFTPPKAAEEWAARKKELRVQLQVALGLWPMPEKTPLNPVVRGGIDREGYTVEKVHFASTPGHYVTGNLYRPKGKTEGLRPAVLCPHGHWPNGRFYETPANKVATDIKAGAEKTEAGAKYPLQARMAMLAKLGFVVFHYDMIGYADSTAIAHRGPWQDVAAELRSQNIMGLQTWNSIRALDFVESLPGIDAKRIGVTGASGGGTQTFILCALDDRPAAAFPAVMVSTAMQGGCTCENCSNLRVGTGNVEIAAMFAPKPQAMSCADDWTKEFMTKGFPELQKLYALVGAEQNVAAKAWTQYPHNYNQPAREFMYSWFNKHLMGRDAEVSESPFVPVPPKELAVFDAENPRPKDELDAEKLRAKLWATWTDRFEKLTPKDAKSLAQFRELVGGALRAMVGGMPTGKRNKPDVQIVQGPSKTEILKVSLGRSDAPDLVPAIGVKPNNVSKGPVVFWLHPKGKASLFDGDKYAAPVQKLLDAKCGVIAPDLLGIGESTPAKPFTVDQNYAGYTFGYNRSLLANRVRDVLTILHTVNEDQIHLVGWGEFGPVAILAKALAGDAVKKTAANVNQFDFDKIVSTSDPMMLPGAMKFGGLGGFLALCAPGEVLAYDHSGTGIGRLAKAAYEATGASDKLQLEKGILSEDKVISWLIG